MVLGLEDEEDRKRTWFGRLAGWKKASLILGVLLLLLAGGVAGGGWFLYARYENRVGREALLPDDASAPAEQSRREQNWRSWPLNLLLLGSDSRATEPGGTSPIGERSDTIMLVHIAASRDKATIVSIPRDSYVDIPAGGSWKGGKNKINAAFAFGGAKLTAATVRQLSGVPLDGAMIADFASIHHLVDAVDGVHVCVPYDVRSRLTGTLWKQGCHDLDGDEAEDFMRQRHDVPGGDIGRIGNQQLVVKAVIAKVSAGDLLSNPMKYDNLMVTVAGSLTVDQSLDLQRLALAVRDIRPGALSYATVPFTSTDLKTPAGSAVRLDPARSAEMFAAIRDDTIDTWLDAHPAPGPRG
nr:LCP family protein [uncultured Actinoplanes sp.]